MESKFLKRFRGRLLSLERSDQFENLIPISKAIKPYQIYYGGSNTPSSKKDSNPSPSFQRYDTYKIDKNKKSFDNSYVKSWKETAQPIRKSLVSPKLRMNSYEEDYYSLTPKSNRLVSQTPVRLSYKTYELDANLNQSLRFTPTMNNNKYRKDVYSPVGDLNIIDSSRNYFKAKGSMICHSERDDKRV